MLEVVSDFVLFCFSGFYFGFTSSLMTLGCKKIHTKLVFQKARHVGLPRFHSLATWAAE